MKVMLPFVDDLRVVAILRRDYEAEAMGRFNDTIAPSHTERVVAMSDGYRFPTEDEEEALVEELEELFESSGIGTKPVFTTIEEFAELLLRINPDAFGGKLENAEKWLNESIQEFERQMEQERDNSLKKFLADFPTTTAH